MAREESTGAMTINKAQKQALAKVPHEGAVIENSTDAGDLILTFPDRTAHIEIDVAGNVFHCPGPEA